MNLLVCCLTLLLFTGVEPQDRRGGSRRGKGIAEGKEAPDFKLKRLLTSEIERTGESEYVKLSDYEKKKPVVLIFGSYT